MIATYAYDEPKPMHISAASNRMTQNTSKERDAETGLDFFLARYYSGAEGRFMTPDWSAKPQPVPYARFDNPQTLNLYAYVQNNPLSRIDPDGHIDCSGKNAQGAGCLSIAEWNAEHGISTNAKKRDFSGVPVKLPNVVPWCIYDRRAEDHTEFIGYEV